VYVMQRIHLTHLFPHMDKVSKFLEDMTVSKPQLPAAYRKLTLDPPVVDEMINLVPSLENSVDQVVNMVTSVVEPVDQVVNLIPSSVDPTLLLESETQAVDPFPTVDPILPLENATQVVDLISSSSRSYSPCSRVNLILLTFFSLIQNLPYWGTSLLLPWNPLQVMRPSFLIGVC
jgi:hypothetical protein